MEIASEAGSGRATGRHLAAVRLAIGGWVLFVLLAVVTLGFEGAAGHLTVVDLANAVAFLAFASMGARLATLVPTNGVGWTLLVVALGAIAERAVGGYVTAGTTGSALPAVPIAAWVDSWLWGVSVGAAVVALPSIFPDGHLPSGRLGTWAWLMLGLFALAPVFFAVAPGPFVSAPTVENPFGIAFLAPIADAGRQMLQAVGLLPIVSCAAIPVLRFQRAGPDERAQLKWFVFAAVLLTTVLIANVLTDGALEIPLAVAIALVPGAIGIAITRYRLYDIDLIINRTLVWVPLTALLGGGYAALVALLQRVFVNLTGDKSDAAIIISTLVLASLFTPVRRVLDSIVDARFRAVRPAAASAAGAGSSGSSGSVSPQIAVDDDALTRRIEEVAGRVVRDALADERLRRDSGAD